MNSIRFFLFIYSLFNKIRLLNFTWLDKLFIYSYFSYKKYFEDPYLSLTKNHPDLFTHGHILDVGANIGYTAYVFSKVVSPPFLIFAFEPEHKNYQMLAQAAKLYGFLKSIFMVNAAVGATRGEALLWRNTHHPADHRILTDTFKSQLPAMHNTQKTPLMTIDHFLHSHDITAPVSFIKIDVQGYELAVCQGMEKTLDNNPNCIIAFEYCPCLIKKLGYDAHALIQFFLDKQYFLYRLHKNGRLSIFDYDYKTHDHINEYYDVICSLKKLISVPAMVVPL